MKRIATLVLLYSSVVNGQIAITNVSPASGAVGSPVIITGTGFNTTAANNAVYFGSAKAVVSTATATTIEAIVPYGFNNQPLMVANGSLSTVWDRQFIVTYPGADAPLTSGSFTTQALFATATVPREHVSADLDGDNKPDIVITNFSTNSISTFKNNSTSSSISFSYVNSYPVGLAPGNIAVGDLDGDGRPDVVAGNSSTSKSLSVLLNTTTGAVISLASKIDFVLPDYPTGISITDIDGDGKAELIATCNTGVLVYKNNSVPGTLSLAAPVTFATGTYPSGLVVTDINANGKPDIIVGNNVGATISILNNTSTIGTLSFDARVTFTTAYGPYKIAVGNLNYDNMPDIAVTSVNSGVVSVLLHTAGPTAISFGANQDFSLSPDPSDVELGDVNGDGKLDMVVSVNGPSNTISVFRNTNSGIPASFAAKADYVTAGKNRDIVLADYRNVGRLDISSVMLSTFGISFLKNNTATPPSIGSFTPASGGEGTYVTINGSSLAGVTAVSFGGVPASNITVVNDTKIIAMVNGGATGDVVVTTPAGTFTLPGFTFVPRITLNDVVPMSGYVGQKVKITGTLFSTNPADNFVYFGGVKAVVNSASANMLMVTVPDGALYAPVSVTVNGSTASSKKQFNVLQRPAREVGFSRDLNYSFLYFAPNSIGLADFDGDGKEDMFSSDYGDDYLRVIRNTSKDNVVSYAPVNSFTAGTSNPYESVSADFDGDGKLDVVMPGHWSSAVGVFRNTSVPGAISFGPAQVFMVGAYPDHIAIGDVDGDGKPDMVVNNESALYLTVLRNTSSGSVISFAAKHFPVAGYSRRDISVGDIDGDGKVDILVPNTYDTSFSIYRNLSTPGVINLAQRIDIHDRYAYHMSALTDIDGDDKLDFIFRSFPASPNRDNDSLIAVYRNTSTPDNFTWDPVIRYHTKYALDFETHDMDGDGKPEIVFLAVNEGGGYLSQIFSLKNNSTPGNISMMRVLLAADSRITLVELAIGDLDGDRRPDIAYTDNNGSFEALINYAGVDKGGCPNRVDSLVSNITGLSYWWEIKKPDSAFRQLWSDPGITGEWTSTLKFTNVPASWTGYQFRCRIWTGSRWAYTKVFTIRLTNEWTGAVDNNWETPGNWSCGHVPGPGEDVIIREGVIQVNSNVTIRYLRLDPAVTFTVMPGYTITVTN